MIHLSTINNNKIEMCAYVLDCVLNKSPVKGLLTHSVSVNAAMTLAVQLSLTTMESLKNGVATHFRATPLWSMRTVSQVSAALTLTLGVNGP